MLQALGFLLFALIVSIGFGCFARRMMQSDEERAGDVGAAA